MKKAIHIIRAIYPELKNNPAYGVSYHVDFDGSELVLRGPPYGEISIWYRPVPIQVSKEEVTVRFCR